MKKESKISLGNELSWFNNVCNSHDLSPIVEIIGYNPTGSFSIKRDEKLLSKLNDSEKIGVVRDLSILTCSPIRLTAAWLVSKTKGYSPRTPLNPFMVPNKKCLCLFFEKGGRGLKPREVDDIISDFEEFRSVVLHDLRVKLERLGVD